MRMGEVEKFTCTSTSNCTPTTRHYRTWPLQNFWKSYIIHRNSCCTIAYLLYEVLSTAATGKPMNKCFTMLQGTDFSLNMKLIR